MWGYLQSGRRGLQARVCLCLEGGTWLGFAAGDTLDVVLTVRKAVSHHSRGQAVRKVPVGCWSPRFSHRAGAHPQPRAGEAALLTSVCRDKPEPPCSVSAWAGVFPEPGSIRIPRLAWPMVSSTLWPHFVPTNIVTCLSEADLNLHGCNPAKTPN